MSQHFSLLTQQNLPQPLPSSSSEVKPVFSPKHDLLLIPGADASLTVAHLQKPLFRENLNGPFSFRPDGLLFNSDSEGIMMDQERRKWRGGVGRCVWLEMPLEHNNQHTKHPSASPSSLLPPLYVLNDSPDSAHQSNDTHQWHIDHLMHLVLPQNNSYLMALFNDNILTCKLFAWIKVATLPIEQNPLYDKSVLVATMTPHHPSHPCRISLMEYGEYGMQMHVVSLNLPYKEHSLSQHAVDPTSHCSPSLPLLDTVSRHLSHLQYLLLDKLPKVLEFMDSAWTSFYTGLLQKRLVHTYPECDSDNMLPFASSLLHMLINGECAEWRVHKLWLTEHATEKTLTKIIKSLHSSKSTIVSYMIHFIQPYIQHALHHLTSLRAHALHQQQVHRNELFPISLCTSLIDNAKAFYAQTHQFMNQFSSFYSELMNLLSYLMIHQAKCASASDQKQAPSIPDIVDPASVNTHRLISFLYSLTHNGNCFEHLLKNPTLQQSGQQSHTLHNPFQNYFNAEGSFTRIHQELIVNLSTLIDEMSNQVSKHVHVTKKAMLPVYDPSNVEGFAHESSMYWGFMSSGKFVCLNIGIDNQVSMCILNPPPEESVKQFQFYKRNENAETVLIFLMENVSNHDSLIKTCVLGDSHFEMCSDLSSLTRAVEEGVVPIPFVKMRKCEGVISQICVGTRGLCAAFGKQQMYIFDIETDEDESSDDEEAGGEDDE